MELNAYTAYGLGIRSEVPLTCRAAPAATPVDLTVQRAVLPVPPALNPTKIYRAGLNAQFARLTDDRLLLVWPTFGSFLAVGGRELRVDSSHTDPEWLSLFALSEALGLVLFQRGYFLLHGSAVRHHGRGVVFLGLPGAGKSTTAAAFVQQGGHLLSDDLVCLRVDDTGTPTLVPAGLPAKLWETAVEGLGLPRAGLSPVREGATKYAWAASRWAAPRRAGSASSETDEVPLDRIFVLEPPGTGTGDSQVRPSLVRPSLVRPSLVRPSLVRPSQIPALLLNHFPLPDDLLQGTALRAYFRQSARLAQTTPVSTVQRPADFARLRDFVDFLKTTA